MAIQGLRTTGNFVADQRPQNYREVILMLYPNGNVPLTALTAAMKSEKVDDPQFNWWEKDLSKRRIQLGAAIVAGTTTWTLSTSGTSALEFKVNDLIRLEQTGEIVRVASDPVSATSLVVERGFAGTSAAGVNIATAGVNPHAFCIGSAFEEGSLAPTGVSRNPVKVYNYAQIFRQTLEMTRTASKTRLRTGDAVKEAKRECLETFSQDMEMAFWFGKRSETTRDGKPVRTTGGIETFIDSGNIKNAVSDHASGVTMDAFEEYLKEMFRYGSSEKMAFCGNESLLTIQQIVRKNSQMNIVSGIKEFGMNVQRLVTPFGELVLKNHPLFNNFYGGTTGTAAYYGINSWMFVLDMANIRYRYIDDVTYEKDPKANGLDGMKSGYIAECGLEIHHAKTHYLVKNLHLAKKDA